MAIRHYFILADERPYNPLTGEDITYRVEVDVALRRLLRNGGSKHNSKPAVTRITVHVTHSEESWGPNTTRIEGYTRNPRTSKASRVLGHHKTKYELGNQKIGVLEVSEDD